jgi:hypothetical protein
MMMATTACAALMALFCFLLEPNSVTWKCVAAFLSFASLVIAVDEWHRDVLTPRFERVWGVICASSLGFLGPAEIVFKDSIYIGKVLFGCIFLLQEFICQVFDKRFQGRGK